MPSKNAIKEYVEEGYYHVYNRGVEKRDIFLDSQDYAVFLKYLKQALDDPELGPKAAESYYIPNNFRGSIELLAFCLMPNHIHLLLKQHEARSMESFSRSVFTRYSMYFNKKYKRVGSLYQGRYKAAQIKTDEYLLHLSRYIHQNPGKNYSSYPYSSYQYYVSNDTAPWLNSEFIVELIGGEKKYLSFIIDIKFSSEDEIQLGGLTLEDS